MKSPYSFTMTEDHSYKEANDDLIIVDDKVNTVADKTLFKLLKSQRKILADELSLPPFVIFQDPSLQDMALKYPITIEELSNVHGVGEEGTFWQASGRLFQVLELTPSRGVKGSFLGH